MDQLDPKHHATRWPAIANIHGPQGAIPACEKHALQLEHLGHFMGYHTNRTPLGQPTACTNCVNEFLNRRQPTP